MTNADELLKKAECVVYDIEIVAAIPEHGKPRDPNLHYCKGWGDHAGMGISVIAAYDWVDSAYRIYLGDGLKEFEKLVADRNIVIGYVNHRFDDLVCRANGVHIPEEKSFDLWKAITDTQPPNGRRGFKLADMLAANGMQSKSGSGADAPMLAQTGQWTKLINYCLDDTRLTVQLLRLAVNGGMKNPKGGGYMAPKMPWEVIHVEMDGIFS